MRLRRFAGVVCTVVLSVGGLATMPEFLTRAAAAPSSGPLFSWGGNIDGELGVGENTGPQTCSTTFGGPCSKSPVQVSLPTGVTAVASAAGWGDSLALGSDSNAYAWGFNNNGQLGNGSTTMALTPTRVSLPTGVTATAIAAGEFHSLAVGSDGRVYAFGANPEGELGNGTTTGSPTPVPASLPAGVTATAVAAGTVSSFAVGSDGRLYTWGEWNSGQQRCDPQQLPCYTSPVAVPLPSGVTATAIVGSDYLGLALGSDQRLYQIDGTSTPTVISLPAGVTPTQIASGNADFYAAGSDGHLYAWGVNNSSGQFGNGTMTTSSTPVQVSLPSGVSPVSFAATTYAAYAIGSDGNLYAWGDNAAGQLGIGNDTGPQTVCGYACSLTPVQVSMPAGQQPLKLGALGQDLYSGYVVTVSTTPPSISGTPPSPANANTAYSFGFSLSGSPAPTTTVTAGSLPPGLTLSPSGVISGTAVTAGSYTATVTAANGVGSSASDTFTIVVNPTLALTPGRGPARTSISVQGAGFQPGEIVKTSYITGLTAPAQVAVCSGTATSSGTVTCTGSIPFASKAGALGAHNVVAKGSTSSIQASTPFVLTSSGIASVAFTGNTTTPTVTITGKGFGAAPRGMSNNTTSCGPYTNNGDDYGTKFYFVDTGNFAAGEGTPPNGSCVGLIVVSWTASQIVFQFGSAYDSFAHWYITAGDGYSVQVKGFTYSGTVGF